MGRHLAMGLRLVACVWLLGNAGCSTDQEPLAEQDQDLVAEQNREPAAKQSGAPQLRTLPEQALSLWQRDIDQYRRHTNDAQALRPQAEEFMRTVQLGMLPRPRGPGLAETAQMGKRLFEQGCKDPLLKAYYGRAVCSDRGCFEAMPVLVESLNAWPQSGYPGEAQRMAVFTLFSEAKPYAKNLDWLRLRKVAAGLAAERVGDGTIGPEMQRAVFYELRPLLGGTCTQDWEDAAAIHEACSNQPKADPWIVHVLAGRAYVSRAWHHRGGGWAYKVTPEGWKLFGEYLEKAAQEFGEALKLHPEWPEAAAFMIPVAMADESEHTPQAWFDKAVAAELDYMPAYDDLRWALRPRWGGSHGAMYQLGCRCADTRRYDTMVPFVLVQVLDNIDEELGYNCEVWRREGVYARAKQVLEGMANDPSRADGSGGYPWRSSVTSIQVAMAERAGGYEEARRLADALGARFDRRTFDSWCAHPEAVLASIYAFTGKGAADITKAWQTLNEAPRPCPDQVLEKARSLFQKALAADDNERSKAYCRARLADIDGRLAFSAGKWFEKKFDPTLLCWRMTRGTWSQENEDSAVGHVRGTSGRVYLRPFLVPLFPLEIEFDVEAPKPLGLALTLGLFIPEGGQTGVGETTYHQFFVRTRDNLAGIEIAGQSKTVPCPLKPVNRIRVQLADGQAVLYVNGQFCLDRSEKDFHPQAAFDLGCHSYLYPSMPVRVSNVRIRNWEPPKNEVAPKKNEETAPTKREEVAPGKTTRKNGG